jgi:hypothetical protein
VEHLEPHDCSRKSSSLHFFPFAEVPSPVSLSACYKSVLLPVTFIKLTVQHVFWGPLSGPSDVISALYHLLYAFLLDNFSHKKHYCPHKQYFPTSTYSTPHLKTTPIFKPNRIHIVFLVSIFLFLMLVYYTKTPQPVFRDSYPIFLIFSEGGFWKQ